MNARTLARLVTASGLLVVLAACNTTPKVPATAARALGGLANGTYVMVNVNSGKVMSVVNAATANGTHLHQWTNADAPDQKWKFEDTGDGSYKIINAFSNKAMDVSEVSTANGAILHLWDYVGGANQRFTLSDVGNGSYSIKALHSGKVVEIGGLSKADGGVAQQWDWADVDSQKWRLVNVNGTPNPTLTPQPTPAATQLMIYDDALASGWQDWSWSSTVNLGATAPVQSGSKAISVSLGAWGGLSLRAPQPVSLSGFDSLSFAAYGAPGGSSLRVSFNTEDSGDATPYASVNAPEGVWTRLVVPLRDMGNPGQIKRINITDGMGQVQGPVGIDDLKFVGQTNAPTPTTGGQAPIFVPDAKPKIVTDPNAALIGVNQELVINAKVADINGKTYPASSLEWKSLNPNVLQIVGLENNGYRARVKVTQANQGGQLLVRSKDDASIVSDVILVANATLQSNVRTVPDAAVLFPAKQWDFYNTSLPSGYDNTNVGSFTSAEVVQRASTDVAGAKPMVVRGTDYAVGDLLIAGGGAGVNGRVEAVLERDGNSLLTVKPVTPGVLMKDMVIAPPEQSDLTDWVNSGTSVALNSSSQSGVMRPQAVDIGGFQCETSYGLTGAELSFKSSASIQPIATAAPSVVNGRSNATITLGARIPVSISASINFPLGAVLEAKCTDKKFEQRVSVPVGGPFSAFLIAGELKIAPVIKISVSAKAIPLSTTLTAMATPIGYGTFTIGDDGFQGGEFKLDIEKRGVTTTAYASSPGSNVPGITELKVAVGFEGKGGLSLGGKVGTDFRAGLDKFPSNPITDFGRGIVNLASYFNIFKIFSGVEEKAGYANRDLLKAENKNMSGAGISLVAQQAFENDQANAFLGWLKSVGFNSNKLIAMKGLEQTLELEKQYSGLKSSDVTFNGKTVASDGTVQISPNGTTVQLTTVYQFPSSTILNPVDAGYITFEGESVSATLTANGAVLSGKLDSGLCSKFGGRTPTGHIWAYNKMFGLLPTASLIGKYTFTCSSNPVPPTGDLGVPQTGDPGFDSLPAACASWVVNGTPVTKCADGWDKNLPEEGFLVFTVATDERSLIGMTDACEGVTQWTKVERYNNSNYVGSSPINTAAYKAVYLLGTGESYAGQPGYPQFAQNIHQDALGLYANIGYLAYWRYYIYQPPKSGQGLGPKIRDIEVKQTVKMSISKTDPGEKFPTFGFNCAWQVRGFSGQIAPH